MIDDPAIETIATRLYDHMRPEHPLPYDACEKVVLFVVGCREPFSASEPVREWMEGLGDCTVDSSTI